MIYFSPFFCLNLLAPPTEPEIPQANPNPVKEFVCANSDTSIIVAPDCAMIAFPSLSISGRFLRNKNPPRMPPSLTIRLEQFPQNC